MTVIPNNAQQFIISYNLFIYLYLFISFYISISFWWWYTVIVFTKTALIQIIDIKYTVQFIADTLYSKMTAYTFPECFKNPS